MKLSNKSTLIFWGITSVLVTIYFLIYYSSIDVLARLLLGVASSATILAIIDYKVQVHISMIMLFINQIALLGVSILTEGDISNIGNSLSKINYITPELLITIVGLFSGLYLAIKNLKKSKKKINISNICILSIKPFKIPGLANFLVIGMMVSVIMTMAIPMKALIQQDAILPTAVMVLPSLILLVSIVPIEITPYIRVIYYMLWILVIQMMVSVNGYGLTNMLEPLVYMLSVIIGNAYGRWNENKEFIKKNV